MKLKADVTFRQYLKLLFSLAYEKPVMRVLLALAGLVILWIVFHWLNLLNLPKPEIYQYITLLLILVIQPLGIFYMIRRNYYSSNLLKESLQMELSDNDVKITGETFYMEILWSKVYRVDERDKWFLIYLNNLSAILISKRELSDEKIDRIRNILKAVPTSK
jgi:hypothetical protein